MDTNKIAEETRKAIALALSIDLSPEGEAEIDAIIQAAIEKALVNYDEQGLKSRAHSMGEGANRSQRLRAHIPYRAAHAGEEPAHASEELIDLILGDLVRETNIFPNQVERAKELIRERLNEKGIKETCQREP